MCGKEFRTSVLWLALAVAATPVAGQQFINLDFEQAKLPDPWPAELFPFLPWAQAAPGWSHSTGDDTDPIIFGEGHIGQSQWYVLRDNQSLFGHVSPESGAFSMGIGSGYSHANEPHGEWVQAFIAQRGAVPDGTVELRLFSSGFEFQVQIDGVPIAMVPLGLPADQRNSPAQIASYVGLWSGDVSSFAGQAVDLRIVNNVSEGGRFSRIVLDSIIFLPIPEPSTWILFAAGIGTLLVRGRRPKDQ